MRLPGLSLATVKHYKVRRMQAIIGRILALLEATKHPYVIIGDWQNPPEAIASTVLPAKICLYDNPTNAAAQHWADWLSKTEQYLLQERPWAAQGRGVNLQAVAKPLVPTTPTQTWRKGKPAFWEQLKARFQLALQQPETTKHGPVKGFIYHTSLVQVQRSSCCRDHAPDHAASTQGSTTTGQ